jgi:hypothetical protein
MATTTPNFGWTVPTSSDLVKDGATAIETLGDGIDASFVDLKGGTTGQVLSKASGTDLDFTWVAQDDSNAIQNAIVDAKGDLIGATAADTPARLAVGTNGQVLTADSTAATGLKWATPASGSTFVGCSVKRTANKTITNNTVTKVDFDAENFDTNGFHDNVTNNTRLTIPTGQGGYYLITWNAMYEGNTSGYRAAQIKINGATGASGTGAISGISSYSPAQNQLVLNLVATDYIELETFQTSGGNLRLFCEAEWPNGTILTLMRLGS